MYPIRTAHTNARIDGEVRAGRDIDDSGGTPLGGRPFRRRHARVAGRDSGRPEQNGDARRQRGRTTIITAEQATNIRMGSSQPLLDARNVLSMIPPRSPLAFGSAAARICPASSPSPRPPMHAFLVAGGVTTEQRNIPIPMSAADTNRATPHVGFILSGPLCCGCFRTPGRRCKRHRPGAYMRGDPRRCRIKASDS